MERVEKYKRICVGFAAAGISLFSAACADSPPLVSLIDERQIVLDTAESLKQQKAQEVRQILKEIFKEDAYNQLANPDYTVLGWNQVTNRGKDWLTDRILNWHLVYKGMEANQKSNGQRSKILSIVTFHEVDDRLSRFWLVLPDISKLNLPNHPDDMFNLPSQIRWTNVGIGWWPHEEDRLIKNGGRAGIYIAPDGARTEVAWIDNGILNYPEVSIRWTAPFYTPLPGAGK